VEIDTEKQMLVIDGVRFSREVLLGITRPDNDNLYQFRRTGSGQDVILMAYRLVDGVLNPTTVLNDGR
jgi:hypothetical protein